MNKSLRAMRKKAEAWLRQGISPRRLALTLALGFAIGCIPLFGVTTALCLLVAVGFRLNIAAIQAANCLSTPLQVALIYPFMRMGGWLFQDETHSAINMALFTDGSPLKLILASGHLVGQAMGAWFVTAAPAVALLTVLLTAIFRKVPVLAAAESEN